MHHQHDTDGNQELHNAICCARLLPPPDWSLTAMDIANAQVKDWR